MATAQVMSFTMQRKTDRQGLIATALVFAIYVSAVLLMMNGRL